MLSPPLTPEEIQGCRNGLFKDSYFDIQPDNSNIICSMGFLPEEPMMPNYFNTTSSSSSSSNSNNSIRRAEEMPLENPPPKRQRRTAANNTQRQQQQQDRNNTISTTTIKTEADATAPAAELQQPAKNTSHRQREKHSIVERRYRQRLQSQLDRLHKLVSEGSSRLMSEAEEKIFGEDVSADAKVPTRIAKNALLKDACSYIIQLQTANRALEAEIKILRGRSANDRS